uniref:Uncharacterized protein n=1 Tax=Candidatus Phytoplasma australasiaticum subsp. australasiaticum TaxID=2832407 RepID=A0A7S7JLQ5_9MOLU|nr:hypothetical protein H7685_02430 ['Parthenium hysterophorus' phyllody phytoplasma]
MNKIYESLRVRYPSIYYELQKMIVLYYLTSLNHVLLKNKIILKHSEDIENILIQVHYQKNKTIK